MTFADWLIRQFVGFNVLTMIVIVLFNYLRLLGP